MKTSKPGLLFSLLLAMVLPACSTPGGLPDGFPTATPSHVPQDHPSLPEKPDQTLLHPLPLQRIAGKIAYESSSSQFNNPNPTADLSLYVYEKGKARRLSTDTLPSSLDLNHQFAFENSQLGYFGSDEGQSIALYMQALDGGEATRLRLSQTGSPGMTAMPGISLRWALSATNKLAVAITPAAGKVDIWLGKPDGTGLLNVTQAPGNYFDLSWSPDGSKLAYFSDQPSPGIYVMDAAGGNRQRLSAEETINCFEPSWSPDGSKILFSAAQGGIIHLFTVRPDGTELTQLTHDGSANYRGHWSPDGSKILYTMNSGAVYKDDIFVMNADGSQPVNLTKNPAQDVDPVWSPDGRQIAFTSSRNGNQDIYVMNADGTDPFNLTNSPGDEYRAVWAE
ncbi:MAG TPA: hypothetical protein V6D23_02430 [Candidatus Obscuribacterales bacterium]